MIKNDTVTLLSFVIPCYRSEHTIEKVIQEIIDTVGQRKEYDYEIVAVNDCSPDNVYEVLKGLARNNKKIKVLNFTRNMGKDSAILAGFSVVKGDYIVNLDDDYQSPVNELWRLLEPVERDLCDCATAEYYIKKESWLKRMGSDLNMHMAQSMIGQPKGIRFENFSIMKAFVTKEIIHYRHPFPYLEGLLFRVTRRVMSVRMEERERGDDNSTGFTLKKSISLIANGLTAFSVKPLRVASICGCLFAMFGFLFGIFTVIQKIVDPTVPIGYSSLVCAVLISGGLIMLMLGIIGEYLGRIYICINDSPQYVIRESINVEEENEGI